EVMRMPPRSPKQKILGRPEWLQVAGYGLVITITVLTTFAYALLGLNLNAAESVTIAFLTLALAQLWHVFNIGGTGRTWLSGPTLRNRYVWGAVLLCVVLLMGAVYWQPASALLSLRELSADHLMLAVGASFAPLVLGVLVRVGRAG